MSNFGNVGDWRLAIDMLRQVVDAVDEMRHTGSGQTEDGEMDYDRCQRMIAAANELVKRVT